MTKQLTIKEVARMGGKARWKNIDKANRSLAMKLVRCGGKNIQQKTIDEVVSSLPK